MNNSTPPPALPAAAASLAGHVVLVTGAGSGLGRATALAAAAHGATVVLLGRTPRTLAATHDSIEDAGGPAPMIHAMDLATCGVADYQQLADALEQRVGRVDGVVHAAAEFAGLCPIEHFDPGDWARAFQVNVHAPFLITRALLPVLRRSPSACVIFITDAPGRHGRAYWGAYAATKAAVTNLAQVVADEVAENTAIRVHCLDPGPLATGLRATAFPGGDPARPRNPETATDVLLELLAGMPGKDRDETLIVTAGPGTDVASGQDSVTDS